MINRNGYEVISEEDYYKEIMNEIKKQYPNMTEHPSNILVILARVLAKNENKRDYDRMESYSSAYIATATEKSLSKAVKIAGISRYSGTSAVGKIIITKAPEVEQLIIPKEMVIKSGINKYKTINSGAIILNDETLELEIVSSEIGMKYNISKESKFQTILNIMGIKNIVAKTNIEGGTDMESDAALRARYYARMNSTVNSSLKGVLDYVESVPDVVLVSGIENSSDSIKDGMAPHSISIFAEGATDYDVAKAIMNSKPAGI
ncbi:MAG: baseplate J/gp47 family protein, partial [Fusobacteriaceae bacterium]